MGIIYKLDTQKSPTSPWSLFDGACFNHSRDRKSDTVVGLCQKYPTPRLCAELRPCTECCCCSLPTSSLWKSSVSPLETLEVAPLISTWFLSLAAPLEPNLKRGEFHVVAAFCSECLVSLCLTIKKPRTRVRTVLLMICSQLLPAPVAFAMPKLYQYLHPEATAEVKH